MGEKIGNKKSKQNRKPRIVQVNIKKISRFTSFFVKRKKERINLAFSRHKDGKCNLIYAAFKVRRWFVDCAYSKMENS